MSPFVSNLFAVLAQRTEQGFSTRPVSPRIMMTRWRIPGKLWRARIRGSKQQAHRTGDRQHESRVPHWAPDFLDITRLLV